MPWVGLLGVEPKPRTAPSSLADQSLPGRGGREDAAESLREHGELAGGHVPKRRGCDHATDLRDLFGRQSLRRGVGAGRCILEFTRLGCPTPRAEARRRESNEPEGTRQAEHALRTIDSAKEPGLVGGAGNAQPRQIRLKDLDQRKEEAEHGFDSPQPTLQPHDTHAERGVVSFGRGGRDDGPCSTANPARRGGSRNPVSCGVADVPGLADEANEAVVVGALPAARGHRAIVGSRHPRRSYAWSDRVGSA